MEDDITLMLTAAKLLRKAGESETVLNPLERFGVARALSACGHLHFIFTPEMSISLAVVIEAMAAQVQCLGEMKEVSRP